MARIKTKVTKNGKVKSIIAELQTDKTISNLLTPDIFPDIKKKPYTNTAGHNKEMLSIPISNNIVIEDEDKNTKHIKLRFNDKLITLGILKNDAQQDLLLLKYIENTTDSGIQKELLIMFDYYENSKSTYNIAKIRFYGDGISKMVAAIVGEGSKTSTIKKKKAHRTNDDCPVQEIFVYTFDNNNAFAQFHGTKFIVDINTKITYLTFHLLLLKQMKKVGMTERMNS